MADHIFAERDGTLQFVGDFDALYAQDADPWGQSGAREDTADYYRMSRGRLSAALAQLLPSQGRRIEIGCGHGWTLPQLEAVTGERWEGMDICAKAVSRARELHKAHAFYVGDIASTMPAPPNALARYDCVVMSQLLWYILPGLDKAISNAARFLDVGGLLVFSQAFLREQRYGREYVDGFTGLVRRVMHERFYHLDLIEARTEDSGEYPFNDGLIILRKTRHAE